jgi:hypothetical protein
MSPRRQKPPLRHCRECGCALRSWREAPLCGTCTKAIMAERARGGGFRRRG